MNEHPYLVLWFSLAFFGLLVVVGVYSHYTAPPPPVPSTQASTQPSLLERLIAEHERRMRPDQPTTASTSPSTTSVTSP